jgi:hypothetical protein
MEPLAEWLLVLCLGKTRQHIEGLLGCKSQVATVLADDRQLAQALSNTWVRRVRISLPLVALAADDALLTFGDTLQRTLQPADAVADTR